MKRTMTAVSLALALAFAASAQAQIFDNGTGNLHNIDQKGADSDATIEQNSDYNNATIVQGSKKSLTEHHDNSAFIVQGELGQGGGGVGGNDAYIEQKGGWNLAGITQIPSDYSDGVGNVARIKQSNFTGVTDNPHEALIYQSGNYNNAEIEQKDGQGNHASIWQVGDGSVKAEIDQKGSNNHAVIFQCGSDDCGPGGGLSRHSAEIGQGDGNSTTTGNYAVIYQQGSWVDLELIVHGHTAKIEQGGFNNWAGIAQTQTGVEDQAFISQDGMGNGAIGIQGQDPGIRGILIDAGGYGGYIPPVN